MARAFVVIEVPSQETLIGQMTMREPGCTVDLLGRPEVHAGEHMYQLHYVVRGVSPESKATMEAKMPEVYSRFETLAYEEGAQTWTVSCEVPVANIRSPGLRFIAGLFGLAPMPWIIFRDGVAHARLLPGREEAIVHVAESLAKRMHSVGIDAEPRVEIDDHFEHFQARIVDAGWGG